MSSSCSSSLSRVRLSPNWAQLSVAKRQSNQIQQSKWRKKTKTKKIDSHKANEKNGRYKKKRCRRRRKKRRPSNSVHVRQRLNVDSMCSKFRHVTKNELWIKARDLGDDRSSRRKTPCAFKIWCGIKRERERVWTRERGRGERKCQKS